MIKLERGNCPAELDASIIAELTRLYNENKQEDVWNSPKIKQPLKDALTHMSHGKCAYCECTLDIESKDVTIDHFNPKAVHGDRVLEWNNLLPSCLRCNRTKNKQEDEIINPCTMEPKEFLGINKRNPYKLIALENASELGENTLDVLDLNNIKRVRTARYIIGEGIIDRLVELEEDITHGKMTKREIKKLRAILQTGQEDMPYSAVISTLILNNTSYQLIKQVLIDNLKWTVDLDTIEKDLIKLSLEVTG